MSFFLKNSDRTKPDLAIWVLIVANLAPLAGVLFGDWDVFEVVLIYWMENVIIGIINILKMAVCSPDLKSFDFKTKALKAANLASAQDKIHHQPLIEKALDSSEKMENIGCFVNHGMKFFLIPFFTFHYGLFCLVHGIFVFALLSEDGPFGKNGGAGPHAGEFPDLVGAVISHGGSWAALALLVSHLFSFVSNYLRKGEYKRTIVLFLMIAPYGRIVVLHVTILLGAFAIMALGSPLLLILLLIAGKILLDLKLHIRAHQKVAAYCSQRAEPEAS